MEENTKKEQGKYFAGFFDILESFVLAVSCVVLFFIFFARLSIVDGRSMESTLHEGDYLIVSNPLFTYSPKNGDIVVIHGDFEGADYDKPLVKRVIATGGQTIKIDFNTRELFINGEQIEESYAQYIDGMRYPDGNEYYNSATRIFEATVPEGYVFAMGDNRNHSGDSRIIGFINEDFIVGKAVFRIAPFSKMGAL